MHGTNVKIIFPIFHKERLAPPYWTFFLSNTDDGSLGPKQATQLKKQNIIFQQTAVLFGVPSQSVHTYLTQLAVTH